jgi:hypothetical protein
MTAQAIAEWLTELHTKIAATIRTHGWFIQYVIGDESTQTTPIAYTVGLTELGHPELVFLGACPETVCGVLNEVGRRIKAGEQLAHGAVLSFDEWPHRVAVEDVPNPGAILFTANRHYGRPDDDSVPALQLTHDDFNGNFPWDEGYSIPAWIQPRPGTYNA